MKERGKLTLQARLISESQIGEIKETSHLKTVPIDCFEHIPLNSHSVLGRYCYLFYKEENGGSEKLNKESAKEEA